MFKTKTKKIIAIAAVCLTLFAAVGSFAQYILPTFSAPVESDDPEDPTGTLIVDNFADFVTAWKDNTCPKIILAADCIASDATALTGGGPGNTDAKNPSRLQAIEVDGQGYTLDAGASRLVLDGTAALGTVMHVHDITLKQNVPSYESANSDAILFVEGSRTTTHTGANTGRWVFRFGNITVPKKKPNTVLAGDNPERLNDGDGIGGVHHLFAGEATAIEFYGVNEVNCTEEIGHPGAITFEDNTVFHSEKMGSIDYSFFRFETCAAAHQPTTTAGLRHSDVIIGQNCFLNFNYREGKASGNYPVFEGYFRDTIVGENSIVSMTLAGNCVRMDRATHSGPKKFLVKKGATVILTSLSAKDCAVKFGMDNASFLAEPGSSVYIAGYSKNTSGKDAGVVNMYDFKNCTFQLDSPKAFDIRNKVKCVNANDYPAFFMGTTGTAAAKNVVEILNTDIDIWRIGQPFDGPSDFSYMDVEYFRLVNNPPTGSSGRTSYVLTQIETSQFDAANVDANGQNGLKVRGARSHNFQRITGMNLYPELLFDDPLDDNSATPVNNPEDADKYVRVRGLLGWVPNDYGMDEDGNIEYVPVFAPAGQVRIWLDSENDTVETADYSTQPNAQLFRDPEDGIDKWFLMTDSNGYLELPPGTKLDDFLVSGTLLRAKALRGNRVGEEFTARVKDVTPPKPAEINGMILSGQKVLSGHSGEAGATVTAAINGTEEVPDASALVNGNGSWSLTLPDSVQLQAGDQVRIYMADADGNKNPVTQTAYSDATFPPASVFTVSERPVTLHIRQVVTLSTPNLSLPDAGYVTVHKRDASAAVLESVNAIVSSGTSEAKTEYTSFTYPPINIASLQVEPYMQQYYEYAGYKISDTKAGNSGSSADPLAGNPAITLGAQDEIWITLYVRPRTNSTTYYAKDVRDNNFGLVHLPVEPTMLLTADNGIGIIGDTQTIHLASQNDDQTITITGQAWGDGIADSELIWTATGGNNSIKGLGASEDGTQYSIWIEGGDISGTIEIQAVSVHDPNLKMEFDIQVVDLIIKNTVNNIEMSQGYVQRSISSALDVTHISFTASKEVDWQITKQTGRNAVLASANSDSNVLTLPARYAGTIYLKAGVRTFRLVITKK